jgi:molybdate transport system substrate-binding protein
MATPPLRIISSMATRPLLAALAADYARVSPQALDIESVGGVDAARRVQAGEAFDAVVLASNAIDALAAAGRVVAGTRTDIVRSGVVVAVKAGAVMPDIGSEEAVKQAVRSARSLACSTGPSGVYLTQLFERWGIADEVRPRIVQAPPGVPVGSLIACGEVELGFQQRSELMALSGVAVVGPLPPAIQLTTVFSGALVATSAQPGAVRAWLAWAASPATAEAKRRNGMEPA